MEPPPCLIQNPRILNSCFWILNACFFSLPCASHIVGHQTCWVSPQKVFWFCQVLFPCTVPEAQNLVIYTPACLFSWPPVYSPSVFLSHYYENDLCKMQSWSNYFSFPKLLKTVHWIPTDCKIKYLPLSMAIHGLALPVSATSSLTTFALQPNFSQTAVYSVQFSSVQFSHSVMSSSAESQHTRLQNTPTPGVYPSSCPLSQWCHPAISSSVIPFSSHPQSLPASGSFPMSQLFASGGQNIGVLASASVLPVNTQDWSPLEWTGWISLQSKGFSRVFSNPQVVFEYKVLLKPHRFLSQKPRSQQ